MEDQFDLKKKKKNKRKEKQQSVDYIKNLDVNLDRNGTND